MRVWLVVVALASVLAGCGGGKTRTIEHTTTVKVVEPSSGDGDAAATRPSGFDPAGIYKREAPGVVTILSVGDDGSDDSGGLGSGFVLNGHGEIATNAHVVTTGDGPAIHKLDQIFVEFSDGNRVAAEIVGFDADADVALLKIDPAGLNLHPLPLGDSDKVAVGAPVAAIGSPFGERQSLSVGIVSAVDRDVRSLTRFQIPGAIQTDAAINPGNSGGPLVDAAGRVLGLNQQIETDSGTGAGVGFAVPIDLAKRSLAALAEQGHVDYAYLGVSTVQVYPQLSDHFHLGTDTGAWVQSVSSDGPSEAAGIKGGSGASQTFQTGRVQPGGDVIVRVGDAAVGGPDDLGRVIARLEPGTTIGVVVLRDGQRKTINVKLAKRPG